MFARVGGIVPLAFGSLGYFKLTLSVIVVPRVKEGHFRFRVEGLGFKV